MVSTSMDRVVLAYPLQHPSGEEILRKHTELVLAPAADPATLASTLASAHAVVLRAPARLTASLMDRSPHLRVAVAMGSGTDCIDVDAATQRGIVVFNTAGVVPQAVAEFALGAMVVAHRRMVQAHDAMLTGELDWVTRLDTWAGTELTGTTLGVVGFGHIGRCLAQMASAAFGMRVLVYDPYVTTSTVAQATRIADLGALLDASTTVSVHVPLSPATRGLIGPGELDRIGPEGVLINLSRGGVVAEEAMLDALSSHRLKAAVVDVFDDEPPGPTRLRRMASVPNLLTSPHIAGVTDRTARLTSEAVAANVLDGLQGRGGVRVVNPAVFDLA